MAEVIRRKIYVRGTVQGVGFRPAVLRYAAELGLTGNVLNSKSGAVIEVQGSAERVEEFEASASSRMPEHCSIDEFTVTEIEPVPGEENFTIKKSFDLDEELYSIPGDIAMCRSCLAEFSDPENRRYRYPFITCGDCGPRYSYVKTTPYDRDNTSMAEFPMCKNCMEEYGDPADRRFHIEGFSCPQCGPKIEGLDEGIENLKAGKVAAVKGIGGFHLTCSALDENAVARLREIKKRPSRAFAVMFRDMEEAQEYIETTSAEKILLQSSHAPIVLVRKKLKKALPENIAPCNGYLGIMLAYSPLHRLILEECGFPIVVTSANSPGDPLIIDDEIIKDNSHLYDSLITHNRKIIHRSDDSVQFVMEEAVLSVRRGRGLMPSSVDLELPEERDVIAFGAELKNSISAVKKGRLITGNHIGDTENMEILKHFRDSLDEMAASYSIKPEVIVCDRHPGFETTRMAEEYAAENGCGLIKVQHHYSHFVAAYRANRLDGKVLGIIFDGTGYGDDGTVWGGEFLVGNCSGYERAGHLENFPLPGGEAAIKEPWRILAGFLDTDELRELFKDKPPSIIKNLKSISLNEKFSPNTSSMGRLFDAVAGLCSFTESITYEAEAAIFLENLALSSDLSETVPFTVKRHNGEYISCTSELIKGLYNLKSSGLSNEDISGIFHNSVIEMSCSAAEMICRDLNIKSVLLSGGVFQNRNILEGVKKRLASTELNAFINREIPACDGGISSGQAIYGALNA